MVENNDGAGVPIAPIEIPTVQGFIAETGIWHNELELEAVSEERAQEIYIRVMEIIDQLNAAGHDSKLMQSMMAEGYQVTDADLGALKAELEALLEELLAD